MGGAAASGEIGSAADGDKEPARPFGGREADAAAASCDDADLVFQ
jgi:hypothetical protein